MTHATATGTLRPAPAAAHPGIHPAGWPPAPATASRRPVSPESALAAPGPLQVTMVATVPANATTGVQPGFRPRTPAAVPSAAIATTPPGVAAMAAARN